MIYFLYVTLKGQIVIHISQQEELCLLLDLFSELSLVKFLKVHHYLAISFWNHDAGKFPLNRM